MAESNSLTIAEAVKLLKVYSYSTDERDNSPQTLERLQKALLMVAQDSEWENIGVCADNLTQGLEALASYLKALGYRYNLTQQYPESAEPVYIKFNTRKMNYYVDSYTGSSRGVLVAMQGSEEAVLGTYGYFPLDFFT
jgi:hypothetical protein